ncbi:MAG: hypothetical protein QMC67_07855 [Candidatus Wallbacteria bacterium]
MAIHEDMTIITPDGEKTLKGLKKIPSMLDGIGVFRDVLATNIDDYHGYFYEFTFKAIPFSIKCTADHLIYTIKNIDDLQNKSENAPKPSFVRASSINIYEYMAMPFLKEIQEFLPANLPIEQKNFWFLTGVVLNRIAIGKMPKFEVNRMIINLFNEELKYVRFPDGINKIPTINGMVFLNSHYVDYINSIVRNPIQIMFLPLDFQKEIYDGFFFDIERPPTALNSQIIFVMWYIYCRMNKNLANIQATKNREYKLNVQANPIPCSDTHIWFRVSDVRLTVEKARVFQFKTESQVVVIKNFLVHA